MKCNKCNDLEVRSCNLTCECNCHIQKTVPQQYEQMWKGFDWEEMPY